MFETFYYLTEDFPGSYYKKLDQNYWVIKGIWGSVNLVCDHFMPEPKWSSGINKFSKRVLNYFLRKDKTHTLADLIVKVFPFWLVSIHCVLVKDHRLPRAKGSEWGRIV